MHGLVAQSQDDLLAAGFMLTVSASAPYPHAPLAPITAALYNQA